MKKFTNTLSSESQALYLRLRGPAGRPAASPCPSKSRGPPSASRLARPPFFIFIFCFFIFIFRFCFFVYFIFFAYFIFLSILIFCEFYFFCIFNFFVYFIFFYLLFFWHILLLLCILFFCIFYFFIFTFVSKSLCVYFYHVALITFSKSFL